MGEWVAFFADGALQKVAVAGGVPSRICSAPGESLGGSWGANNPIVWASRGSGLMRISAVEGCLSGRDSSFDVSPDGKRFVMIKSDDASALRELTVVQNWFDDLRRRVPAPSK
ncbi:MAG TPA: hypothetical protein VGJ78_08265 [Vicinamibacterales bacterium]|jgi:hypothetical protein